MRSRTRSSSCITSRWSISRPTRSHRSRRSCAGIIPLGDWVLRTACNATANLPNDVKVAVNLSPAQLKSRNVVEVVLGALQDSGMSANRLQLEITESVLMHNTFGTLATLHKLRELGVQI